MHAYIHTYMDTYIYTFIHTHIHIQIQIQIHTHIHSIYIYIYIYIYIHIFYIYIYIYLYVCTYIYYMYMYIHTCLHTYISLGTRRGRCETSTIEGDTIELSRPLSCSYLVAECPSPKKLIFSVMVGLYKPQKVKDYLLSFQVKDHGTWYTR